MDLPRILARASVDQLLNILQSAHEDHKGIILQALNNKAEWKDVRSREELISKIALFILKAKSALLIPTLINILNSMTDTRKYQLIIADLLHYNLDGLKNWPSNSVRVKYLLLRNRDVSETDFGTVQEIFKLEPKFISRLDVAALVKFKAFLENLELLFIKLMASDEFFEDLRLIYSRFSPVPPTDIIEEINNLLFISSADFARKVHEIECRITLQNHIRRLADIVITYNCDSGNSYLEWIKFKYDPEFKMVENESLLFYFLDRIEEELQIPQTHPEASQILLRLLGDSNGGFFGSFQKIVFDLLKERPRQEPFFVLPLLAILKKSKLSDIDWLTNYLSFDDLEVRLRTIDVLLEFLWGEPNQEVRLPIVAKMWDAIAKRNDQSLLHLPDLYKIEPDFLSHRADKLIPQRSNNFARQVSETIKSLTPERNVQKEANQGECPSR